MAIVNAVVCLVRQFASDFSSSRRCLIFRNEHIMFHGSIIGHGRRLSISVGSRKLTIGDSAVEREWRVSWRLSALKLQSRLRQAAASTGIVILANSVAFHRITDPGTIYRRGLHLTFHKQEYPALRRRDSHDSDSHSLAKITKSRLGVDSFLIGYSMVRIRRHTL